MSPPASRPSAPCAMSRTACRSGAGCAADRLLTTPARAAGSGRGRGGAESRMAAVDGFHHVKLPVSDLARTRDWYERVLGFAVDIEFVEDGVVTGLALTDPDKTV